MKDICSLISSESKIETCKSYIIAFGIILALGIVLRLPFLSYPPQVVFDEVGFGKFVNAYGWTGKRLFDVHPPHGKLLITAAAKAGGYQGNIDFTKIGTPCAESIAPLRFLPAFAGSLIPVLVLTLLYQIGASLPAAFLGGFLIAFDNAFIVQSRLIGLDTILIFFILSSLSFQLLARVSDGKRKIFIMLLSGTFAGLAVGTKFTGLATLGLTMVVMCDDLLRADNRRDRVILILMASCFLGAAVGIYFLGWKIHFTLMKFSGEGDAFFIPSGNLIMDTLRLNKIMLSANAGITATHPYSSIWWQWPMMKKPIFYWVNKDAGIYLIGNPVVWWGTGAVFAWLMGFLIFGRARHLSKDIAADKNPLLWIPIAGYLISILPLIPIKRPLFLYHYFPALSFSIISAIAWIDLQGFIPNSSLIHQRVSYYFVIGICVIMSIILAPITYGLFLLPAYQRMLGSTGFGP